MTRIRKSIDACISRIVIFMLILYPPCLLYLSGCSSYVPPHPPEIAPSAYKSAKEQCGGTTDGMMQVSIVDLRLARSGIYIDLLFRTPRELIPEQAISTIQDLGTSISSNTDDLNSLFDVRFKTDRKVRLRERQINVRGRPFMPPIMKISDHCYVQTIMARTYQQLHPNTYKIRLTDAWKNESPKLDFRIDSDIWLSIAIDKVTEGGV